MIKKIIVFAAIVAAMGCTKDEGPYFQDCPCETVEGYRIQVCEGQSWEEASFSALALQAEQSNCD